jgi:hypothetical protein
MCVRAQTSAFGIAIRSNQSEKRRKQGDKIKLEIILEKDQPQLSLVELQAAEGSFRQPTPAELSILTFWQTRYARSRAQELSNEFARLLNRGSSLE